MNPSDRPLTSWTPARRALLAHYDEHRRSLPWRGETDPYRILVSEVMLQQTRVETVLAYYGSWLERFPDLEALAAAGTDEVLRAWEGLGYYRRARNLHRTARLVRERPGGALPDTYAELRELPGIGEYTAGAVASIAFGEPVPAPDGNVRRVLARLFDEPAPKPAWLRETAAGLVDPERPGDWNQALMELGATVCTPRRPRCDACPVAPWCESRAHGTQEARPAPAARRAPREAIYAVAVVHRGRRVLLRRRPPEGLLGGMWAFPERQVHAVEEAPASALAIAQALELGWNTGTDAREGRGPTRPTSDPARGIGPADADDLEPLPAHEHRFTHLHAVYLPYLIDVSTNQDGSEDEGVVDPVKSGPERYRHRSRASVGEDGEGAAGVPCTVESRWVDPSAPVEIALPTAQRRILESARDRLAGGVPSARVADRRFGGRGAGRSVPIP